jgi:hypothetical protein
MDITTQEQRAGFGAGGTRACMCRLVSTDRALLTSRRQMRQ